MDSGIIIITSAGNDMTKQDLYPSVYPGVITVTSLDKENNHLYTNNFNDHLTISTPGVDISTSLVDKEKNEVTLSFEKSRPIRYFQQDI
ncbi:S8 family serine peptidase [Paenibacillus sp. JSM ZJ436]|uniref:S8 family serine peptidase n=1 Tax=Paenibacillus sp. JSM ZJ436 TaxID=3376190 RepID=UPI00379A9D96